MPLPDIVTASWAPVEPVELNDADIDWLLASTSWHDVPLQAPLKPENLKPAPGVAVRATELPWGKLATQVEGQLIPAGVLTTVPVPVTVMFNCTGCAGWEALEFPPHPETAIKLNRRTGRKCFGAHTSQVALTVAS